MGRGRVINEPAMPASRAQRGRQIELGGLGLDGKGVTMGQANCDLVSTDLGEGIFRGKVNYGGVAKAHLFIDNR